MSKVDCIGCDFDTQDSYDRIRAIASGIEGCWASLAESKEDPNQIGVRYARGVLRGVLRRVSYEESYEESFLCIRCVKCCVLMCVTWRYVECARQLALDTIGD